MTQRISPTLSYTLLSMVFIVFNLLTLHNVEPWVDEVMFMDTPMRFVKGLGWITHAWYRVAGQPPFQTYPPLYALLLVPWMQLLGTSLVACRSLNLLVVYLLGLAMLRLLERLGCRLSGWSGAALAVLLWLVPDLAWMCRNGRPDLLGALLTVWLLTAVVGFVSRPGRGRLGLVALSALLFLSGIQACVYAVMVLALCCGAFAACRPRLLQAAAWMLAGLGVGAVLTGLFMAAHGRLLAFVANAVPYSETLTAVLSAILPSQGTLMGVDLGTVSAKMASSPEPVSFACRLLSAYNRPCFLCLLGVQVLVFVIAGRRSLRGGLRLPFLLTLLAACVPLLMTLAGRYAPYYGWMALLPLVMSVVLLVGGPALRGRLIVGGVAVGLAMSGLAGLWRTTHYAALHTFVGQQTELRGQQVAAPFSVFYELQRLTPHVYYVGVYPLESLPAGTTYVILPDASAYDYPQLNALCDSLRQTPGLSLTLVDECAAPHLTVYRVNGME